MKQAILYVMDKSGSMTMLRDAVVSAFNEFLHEQQELAKKQGNEVDLTLAMFDADWSTGLNAQAYVIAYDAINIHDIPDMTLEQYLPSGGTALFDAIEKTVNRLGAGYDKVVCVVQTDGEENSSRTATADSVRTLVESKTAEGWLFIYLGAALDEMAAKAHMQQSGTTGFATADSLTYASTPAAHLHTSRTMSDKVSRYLTGNDTPTSS